MKIKDGRGLFMKERKQNNIKKIKEFFNANPNSTKKDCVEATGLSHTTVINLTKEIEGE